jgi:hypothetical protein
MTLSYLNWLSVAKATWLNLLLETLRLGAIASSSMSYALRHATGVLQCCKGFLEPIVWISCKIQTA